MCRFLSYWVLLSCRDTATSAVPGEHVSGHRRRRAGSGLCHLFSRIPVSRGSVSLRVYLAIFFVSFDNHFLFKQDAFCVTWNLICYNIADRVLCNIMSWCIQEQIAGNIIFHSAFSISYFRIKSLTIFLMFALISEIFRHDQPTTLPSGSVLPARERHNPLSKTYLQRHDWSRGHLRLL